MRVGWGPDNHYLEGIRQENEYGIRRKEGRRETQRAENVNCRGIQALGQRSSRSTRCRGDAALHQRHGTVLGAAPIEFITMHSGGRHGATSTKPGNVTLNMRNLVVAIASGTLTITGAMATPWALLLGALVTWDSLWSCLQLEIGEVQARVLWVLWKNRDENNTVAKNYVQDLVNRECAKFGQQSLTEKEVEYVLKDLKKMGCIKESSNYAGPWWLCESVRVSYQ